MNSDIQISQEYVDAVFEQATKALDPEHYETHWEDRPLQCKIYAQVERLPLPLSRPSSSASLAEILRSMAGIAFEPRTIALEELGQLLLFSVGLLNRRLAIHWNSPGPVLPSSERTFYGRGTPSGGGLYPVEVYWACGPSGATLPGLYHYDIAHHALERLWTGDATASIRAAAQAHPFVEATDQFLFISLNFWKNAFKYGSFAYHAGTQDVGALLCSLRMLGTAFSTDLPFLLWFQDETINRLLGLDTLSESVFAVVPLPATRSSRALPVGAALTMSEALGNASILQRSKTVVRFPALERVHRAALIEDELRPDVEEAKRAICDLAEARETGDQVELPAPALDRLTDDIATILERRQSSFGRFSARNALSLEELATILYAGTLAGGFPTDLKQVGNSANYTRLAVFVTNVEGLERGAYSYDGEYSCLWTIQRGDVARFLQEHYLLKNYNLAQTGAVLMVIGSPKRMLSVYGNRGYRMLNVEVGMVAQSMYLAATALSVGCGAVLGFEQHALSKVLGLDGSDERTLLAFLVGHEREGLASFDYRLV